MLWSFWFFVFILIAEIVIFGAIVTGFLWREWRRRKRYEQTEYFRQTGCPYRTVFRDKGKIGEYLIFEKLQKLEGYKKFLFNCYVPRTRTETAEIDVILLHASGIHVFESKNFSGWIFGSEQQEYWTQTLPRGKGRTAQKDRFYNPILQNNTHLQCLAGFLGTNSQIFYSYIVFSERCELKSVTLTSERNRIIKRDAVLPAVQANIEKSTFRLTPAQIDAIYQKLYPFTQISEEEKMRHIKNIRKKFKN